jgi:hypothetical protein
VGNKVLVATTKENWREIHEALHNQYRNIGMAIMPELQYKDCANQTELLKLIENTIPIEERDNKIPWRTKNKWGQWEVRQHVSWLNRTLFELSGISAGLRAHDLVTDAFQETPGLVTYAEAIALMRIIQDNMTNIETSVFEPRVNPARKNQNWLRQNTYRKGHRFKYERRGATLWACPANKHFVNDSKPIPLGKEQ